MRQLYTIFLILALSGSLFSQSAPPKYEFRAAWIAAVLNIDWPKSTNPDVQRKDLITMLDKLKAAGINAVMFHVRTESDALYDSNYDPWSYWLTGASGKAPVPYYDPLKFAIEEAHKRGMELHAWFNPYRVKHANSNYEPDSTHVSKTHPEWVLTFGEQKILDPGLPEVREYVKNVIMDVVNNYDVDGVHFDDYFYVKGIDQEDAATFKKYPRGFTDEKDWRRDNVNLLIKEVSENINLVKPYVKFGISPSGMWRAGYPAGTCGMYSYSDLYADGIAWLQKKIIDYINPQIYWAIGSTISCGHTDYQRIMNWWADSAAANKRHLYVGHAAYRINVFTSSSEMPNQIRLIRNNPKSQGSVFYNTSYFLDNLKGFLDTLKRDFYRYPALTPVMSWKETNAPNAPRNLRFARVNGKPISALYWDAPVKSDVKDTAVRYVIYRMKTPSITAQDIQNAANMFDITGTLNYTPAASDRGNYFAVTAVDRNSNESMPIGIVEITPPPVPSLVSPLNKSADQGDTVTLKWDYSERAGSYSLQISIDSTFKTSMVNIAVMTDTTYVLGGIKGHQVYYWRVSSTNAAGTLGYSPIYSFTTAFPDAPIPYTPEVANTNVFLNPDFKWSQLTDAEKYRLQVAYSNNFSSTVIDTMVADTVINISKLASMKTHYWRVNASNQYGVSQWSKVIGFKTGTTLPVEEPEIVVKEYSLAQNYPNPFNPSTIIRYQLPKESRVVLKVFDILGNEVAVLIDETKAAGSYSYSFNIKQYRLTSGVYIYSLSAGEFHQVKKMILLK